MNGTDKFAHGDRTPAENPQDSGAKDRRGPQGEESGPQNDGHGHLVVERSGGITGMRLVWDVDIDATDEQEVIEERMAAVSWSGGDGSPGQADRYVYLFASRKGRTRLGESELTSEWKDLIEVVRDLTEPQRLPPG